MDNHLTGPDAWTAATLWADLTADTGAVVFPMGKGKDRPLGPAAGGTWQSWTATDLDDPAWETAAGVGVNLKGSTIFVVDDDAGCSPERLKKLRAWSALWYTTSSPAKSHHWFELGDHRYRHKVEAEDGIDVLSGWDDDGEPANHLVMVYGPGRNQAASATAEFRAVPDTLARWIAEVLDPPADPQPERPVVAAGYAPPTLDKVNEALAAAPAAELGYEQWLTVGTALKSTGFDNALDLWDEWSAQDKARYQGRKDLTARWGSLGSKPIHVGALFNLAKKVSGGEFKPPQPEKKDKKQRLTPDDMAQLIAETGRKVLYNTAACEYEEAPAADADNLGAWTELTNRRLSRLCNDISGIAGQTISEDRALRLLASAADEWDPFAHWLDSLPEWDGRPRLDHLITDLWSVTNHRLAQRFGYGLLGSMVARTREPGCKADEVWILASRGQGLGKTTLADSLFPAYGKIRGWTVGGSVDIGDAGSKRFLDQIRPARLVELADIDGVNARDWSKVKAFVSASSDSERLAYDRRSQAMPRIPVFLGTSDKGGDTLLPLDPAGQRRWRILEIGMRPDIESKDAQRREVSEHLDEWRNNLWAEAAARFARGEQYWLNDDDSAIAEMVAMEASHSDTITEAIQAGGLAENSHLTLAQIAAQAGLTSERRPHPSAADQHTATRVLKQIGLVPVRRRVEGRLLRIWVPAATGFDAAVWESRQKAHETSEAVRRELNRRNPGSGF